MNWLRMIAGLLLVAVSLTAPLSLRACPLCADAIANSASDDDDRDDFPATMNQSIFLMLIVPYSMLGIVGFCIYRGARKNDEHRRGLDDAPPPSDV